MSDELIYEEKKQIAVFTLNRPQARNAISLTLAHAISEAMDQFESNPNLRVGVITGAGGTFSSGMDLKGFARGEVPHVPGRGFAGFIEKLPSKPLIAAVEGFALAGGFEIVLACDLVVASREAMFGLPEVTKGIVAAAGGLLRLPRRIPYHLAMELILTGEKWPATRAREFGFVNRLCDPGKALEEAIELGNVVGNNAPLALAASKQVVLESPGWPPEDVFARQDAIVDSVRRSQDAREGSLAFIEKRAPNWKGS